MTGAENCTLCLHTVYLFKKPDTVYTVESAPAEIGWGLLLEIFRLFLGQFMRSPSP